MSKFNTEVTASYAWHNGAPIGFDGGLSLNSRALWYGDGVFETIAIQEGHPIKLDLHLDRLERSADAADLPLPEAREPITTSLSVVFKRIWFPSATNENQMETLFSCC